MEKSYVASLQSSLLIVTVAVFSHSEVGEKVTVNVAEFPGKMGETGVSVPSVNEEAFAPVSVMSVMVKLPVPVFCTVKVRTKLSPTATEPK